MDININLFGDWQKIILNNIRNKWPNIDKQLDDDLVIIRYFAYLRKMGGFEITPRKVHISNEFKCPEVLKKGLDNLKETIEKTGDYSTYLSKKVDAIMQIDGLFNDWGILHLHLGEKLEQTNSSYIERTGKLLFVFLDENDIYFINIYDHGDWAKKEILKIILNNWPHLLEKYIVNSELSFEFKSDEKAYIDIRNKGGTQFIEIEDTLGHITILNPIGAIMSSGDSSIDVNYYYYIHDNLKALEKKIIENFRTELKGRKHLKIIIRLKYSGVSNKYEISSVNYNSKKIAILLPF